MTSPPPPSTPKRKLRWYQFSLRTLLIFVTLFGIACSWFAVKIRQAKRQQEAVAAIIKNEGYVLYDYEVKINKASKFQGQLYPIYGITESIDDAKPSGPDWLRNWLGIDFFDNVVFVWAGINANLELIKDLKDIQVLALGRASDNSNEVQGDERMPNSNWEIIRSLPRIRVLNLSGYCITDEGLENLRGLSQLEVLILDETPITNQGLMCLKDLKNLKELSLLGCYQVKGEGFFSIIKELTQLELLNLPASVDFSDTSLKNLEGLTRLRSLSIHGRSITDAGMQHFKNLKELEQLWIFNTEVDGEGLEQLQGLENLQELGIISCTEIGADYLAKNKHLHRLYVDNSSDIILARLTTLKELTDLTISGDEITDKGIDSLKSFKQIKNLRLYHTKITPTGFKDLQNSLPKVSIQHD